MHQPVDVPSMDTKCDALRLSTSVGKSFCVGCPQNDIGAAHTMLWRHKAATVTALAGRSLRAAALIGECRGDCYGH